MATPVPPQFAAFFPNGLEGPVDWEENRKRAKLDPSFSQWLQSQGIDISQKAAEAAAAREARPGIEGSLASEQAEYSKAPEIARTSTLEDAKRAGTFAKDKNFLKGLDYEAGLRTKGIQTASQARIDELKKQLGYPV